MDTQGKQRPGRDWGRVARDAWKPRRKEATPMAEEAKSVKLQLVTNDDGESCIMAGPHRVGVGDILLVLQREARVTMGYSGLALQFDHQRRHERLGKFLGLNVRVLVVKT